MTKQKFIHKESFQHQYAKELLREWIVGTHQFNDHYLTCPIDFIDEFGNKKCVNWRPDFIFLEYPITKDFPINIDETSACKKSYPRGCDYRTEKKYCPCLKCGFFDKSQLLFVVDLAIEHKGIVACVVEINHKSPISQEKKTWLRDAMNKNCCGLEAFEIDAHHIMGQIKNPTRLFVRSF